MASRERIESQFEQYSKALASLKNAVKLEEQEKSENNEYKKAFRDSAIQRFEYTFELTWKVIKHIADYRGIKVNSPRDAFKAGFKLELIKEQFESVFYEMIEKRNLTVHTYKEETAQEIYEFIQNKALPAFQCLQEAIQLYI